MHKALLGRAGVSLVMFQLLRRGFEAVETPLNSPFGDIWAQTPLGRVSIEVKASSKDPVWALKKGQISSDFFCFVGLWEGVCWVLTRDDVLKIASNYNIRPENGVPITLKYLPDFSQEGWDKLGGDKMNQFLEMHKENKRLRYTSTRIVRRTLADGTIKEYVYPGAKESAKSANEIKELRKKGLSSLDLHNEMRAKLYGQEPILLKA